MKYYNLTKYGNKKTEVDGIVFDSKKESERYEELRFFEKHGEIKNLKIQPEFELIPSFTHKGKKIRKTIYRADFSYIDKTGAYIVEDVKSFITKLNPVYRLKKKLLYYKFPEIEILET